MGKRQMTPKQAIDAALERWEQEDPDAWRQVKMPGRSNSERGLKFIRRRRKFRAPLQSKER